MRCTLQLAAKAVCVGLYVEHAHKLVSHMFRGADCAMRPAGREGERYEGCVHAAAGVSPFETTSLCVVTSLLHCQYGRLTALWGFAHGTLLLGALAVSASFHPFQSPVQQCLAGRECTILCTLSEL